MGLLTSIWRGISHTKALEDSSGKMETAFFESVYRITYVAGLSGSDHSILYKVYSTTVKVMICLVMMGEIWYMVSYFSSLDIVIEQMNVVVILIMAVFRYMYMRKHQDRYQKLATSMQLSNLDVSTPARKALVEFWIQKSETYLKLMLGLGSLTLAAWYVYPLVDDLEYNLTVNLQLPVDYHTPTRYPFAYLTTLIAFHCSAFFIMVNDVIMQAHLIHLICQYTVLADCFENIIVDCEKEFTGMGRNELVCNSRFREAYISRLGLLIEQHKQLLLHTMELRKTISPPMLGQVSASGLQICFAGYQVAMTITVSFTKFFMSLLFLGYNLFELFVICRWCDEIKIQSENIRSALYCSGWECGVATMAGVRARLVLVITRASKPLVLTAGGICDLSLNSYADNTNYKYLLEVESSLKFGGTAEVNTSHHICSDKMNVVGYLITLANLQSFEDSGGPLKDLSIRVSEVETLANELSRHPEFNLEACRQTGYCQVGDDEGKYLSTNLRNYLFHGNVDPKDEGVILTLHYSKRPARQGSITDREDGTLSYYVHKKEDLSDEERQNIYRYLDTVKEYNKRTVSDTAS